MIKFAYTILYVSDVKKAVDFYVKAFGFELKFISKESDYAELVTGNTTLSFVELNLAETNLTNGYIRSDFAKMPFGFEIGFTTERVEETVAKAVSAGATVYEPPKVKSWGQTVAYLRDLDGFLIEICTPTGEAEN